MKHEQFSSIRFTIFALALALALALPATAWALLPGDYTDDTAIVSTSSSIVDFFDLMIWNHFKFTVNGNGPPVGDGNNDGAIDTADFVIWNSNKYTSDNTGCLPSAVVPCVSDAQYLTAFTTAPRNISNLSNSGSAPVFTVTNGFSDLNVTIPFGTVLQSFTVVAPAATSFGTDYGNSDVFVNLASEPTGVTTLPIHGRQQWTVNVGSPNVGWDSANNGLVAGFPTGSLAGTSVFWEIQTGVGNLLEGGEVAIGVQNLPVPEPGGAILSFIALISLGAARIRR